MPKSTSWRHVLPIHPAANLFPLMGSGEMSELTRDIKQKGGILSPVTLWLESGKAPQLLDGRNRLDAMEAAGLTVVDKSGELVLGTDCEVLNPSDGVEPFAFVLSANLHRRHLTPEQKRGVVAGVLKARPGQSNRRIARAAKVDHKTVGAVRTKLEATGEIPQLKETVGADGKKRAVMAAADRAEERAVKQQAKAERRASREADLARKITALPSKRYGLLLADPPWRFEPWSRETGMDRAADNHYPTMTADEIRALDVASIAAPDSVLWLWATAPMLPDALATMAHWGFAYRSHAVWDKLAAGTGYWFRNVHEILLVGVKGNVPAPAPGTQSSSLISVAATTHSAKPEAAFALIESYFPTLPKIELFRRGPPRPGWDAWGNEAEALPASADPDPLAIPSFLLRDRQPATAGEQPSDRGRLQ